jgi:acyl-CoA thioesterase II
MNQPAEGGRRIDVLLQLERCEELVWRSVTADRNLGGEVFGGQYLGLAIGAAMRSAPGRMPHAMTSYFLGRATAAEPVEYHVERTRDGNAFAHRHVSARQHGKEVFRAEVSFHEWEDDQVAHAAVAPEMPSIDTLPSLREMVAAHAQDLPPTTVARVINRDSFESHFADPREGLGRRGALPEIKAWIRPNPPPDDGDAIGYYGTLAYLTDACANFASRTVHTDDLYDGRLLSVSVNHAIWFHVLPRPIETVLYALDSPFGGGGLGINRGMMFDSGGDVLASIVQEALIRRRVPNAQ